MTQSFFLKHYNAFFQALQFLTVLPCPRLNFKNDNWQKSLGLSVLYYPLIGLLLGCILMLGVSVLGRPESTFLSAVLLLVVWVVLSGGLHLDGLADCADAWMGGLGSKEKTLAIMKDPACGTIAVLVLLLVLLLKLAAIEILLRLNPPLMYWVLPFLLGRMAIISILLSTPYVRQGGIGEVLSQRFSRKSAMAISVLSALGILLIFLGLVCFYWR